MNTTTKEVNNNEKSSYACTQSHYCTEPDEIRETISESSFLQANSVIESSENNSSDHLEEKTRLRPSNPNNQQTKNKMIVENLCNQIKYLIEGNLKNEQLKIDMGDIVRDNIIPMLIKMFFQESVGNKSGFFGSKEMASTFESKNRDNPEKTFISQDWHGHTTESFRHNNVLSKFNNNSNSKNVLFSEKPHEEIQIINGEESFITEKEQSEQNEISKLLVFTIILLKFEIVKKVYSFQRLKSFSQNKEKVLKEFINIHKRHKIKICIQKFQENILHFNRKIHEEKIKLQQEAFKQKTASIALHIISKIIKEKIHKYFQLFKNNSLNENKWMKEWVRIAALKSPLTVKTSIWRLKNFLENENDNNKPSSENKKSKKKFETSIKELIIAHEAEASNNPSCQVSKKSLKKSQGNLSERESSEQSITSSEFDAMFQKESEEEIIESEISMKKGNKITNKILEEVRIEEKSHNYHQIEYEELNGYLNTISEDENELSSVCE